MSRRAAPGKTPVVRWMADRLRADGRHVAVLARAYRAARGEFGDEQVMLDRLLNDDHADNRVTVVANPDRVAAAGRALARRPDVDVFVLDDGFQHRRLARDLDVVLLSATNPFGYEHVLPRGMLREPLAGLRRAAPSSSPTPTRCRRRSWTRSSVACGPSTPRSRSTARFMRTPLSAPRTGTTLPLSDLSTMRLVRPLRHRRPARHSSGSSNPSAGAAPATAGSPTTITTRSRTWTTCGARPGGQGGRDRHDREGLGETGRTALGPAPANRRSWRVDAAQVRFLGDGEGRVTVGKCEGGIQGPSGAEAAPASPARVLRRRRRAHEPRHHRNHRRPGDDDERDQ